MKKISSIKGLSITEVLVAFTIFLIALLAVVQLFYQSISIETDTKLKEMAMQNAAIIASYIKTANIITFSDSAPFISGPPKLINTTSTEFYSIDSDPLHTLTFTKPNLFQRNITATTINQINSTTFPATLGYTRVALFTLTIRYREKGKYKTITYNFSLSRDFIR
jgi:Tfp pilus assembly protein PilV